MTGHARVIWLALAALPYLGLVGIDTWMHESARKVPRAEKNIHWALAPLLIGFVVSAFSARTVLALALLAAFLVLLVVDAVGFHQPLARNERRVHAAAYAAFALFVATWLWMDLPR
jgi:predicted histidine transporter YuiF (NhaC family)